MDNIEPQAGSVQEVVARLRKRQRLLHVLRLTVRGFFCGVLLAVVMAVIGIVSGAGWTENAPWRTLWCIPLIATAGAIVGLLRRVDSLRVARALDQAAASEDRFASALQLAGHHRRLRAGLVIADALSAVQGVPIRSALRLRVPGELKWLPLPAIALGVLFWLSPGVSLDAQVVEEPEITAEDWTDLQEDFRRQLDELPKPKIPEEKEITERLEKLDSFLKQRPIKKEALARIAKLRSDLERRRQQLSGRNLSMRQAAQAVRSSNALKQFASRLRRGDYHKAADELKSLAERLRKNATRLKASDFESAASDFDRLASEMASHAELGHACRNCAKAASTMNRGKLANALNRFAKTLRENAKDLKRCDSLCRSCNMLDDLRQRLNRCKKCSGCKSGNCSSCRGRNGFVGRGGGKGGLKAGWGTARTWEGGSLSPQHEQRLPVLASTREQDGSSTAQAVVSREERAESALDYKDVYAEMVQKAEADLSLETVPVAYRDFLRRYFMAIRPQEDTTAAQPED